ncbi:MAG: hypothetical protein INF89_19585, partial [Roseomonas sp.]|nr:hypothetical protein [Roseomonas sp.]
MARIVVAVVAAIATAVAAYYLGPAGAGLHPVFVAIISSVIGATVAYAGNTIVNSLEGRPRRPTLEQNSADAKRLVRGSSEPRRIIYGRARVSGPLIYAASYGSQKEWIMLVIPLADHTCQSIDAVWLGETRIAASEIDGNGLVNTGRFANNVYIKRYLGTQTSADADLVANSPDGWTAADRLTGVTYIYLRMRFNADLFPYGIPNISAEVTGKSAILDPRTSTTAYANNWALCILDYLKAEYGLAATDDEIDLPSFIAAANLADEAVPLNQAGTETQRRYTLDGSFTLDEAPIDIIEKMLAPGG